jgi:RNA polymerase sigma factor (sigma-70 family)
MNAQTDQQLLRDYAGSRSEAAFAELVRRHVDLVYSAALRMVCNSHQAEDVTQGVFVALAQNARQLTHHPVLSGWLHRTMQNLAANAVRTNVRRQTREQEAVAMNELLSAGSDASWEHIAPHLDAALGELSEPDRDALLLRYFERKSAHEMAQTLGISDDAAQKRVNRAVERLREFFAKRGVTVGASGLVVVISANAVQAAPVALAASISTAVGAVAGTMIATATATATKAMTMTVLHKTIIGAALAAIVGAGIYEARQTLRLRGEVQTLRQQQGPLVEQIAQLKSDNENLSQRLAQAKASVSSSSDRLRELLRLRGEVALLRRQNGELERAVVAQSKTREVPGQPAVGGTPQPARPLPFQLQLVLDEPGDNSEAVTNHASVAGETLYVQKTPLLDYTAVRSATVTRNASSGAPEINVEFSPEGKELFAAITRENISRRLAIVLDGHLYSAPVIRSEISGGQAQITGSFTEEEAKELVARINEAAVGDLQVTPR